MKHLSEKYDKIATWWHAKHIASDYGVAAVRRAISYCKMKGKALDVGCGSGGRIINLLSSAGFDVTGIDISMEMLRLAKINHPDVRFERAEVLAWQTEEKFDFIVAWDSIFHLPQSAQESCIRKLSNLLNTGGTIVYTFGDAEGDHSDLSFKDEAGNQIPPLKNDYFVYGSIGIHGNLHALEKYDLKCLHLEIDQYPMKHVFIIAQKTPLD